MTETERIESITRRVSDELCIMRRLATLARAQDDLDRDAYRSCFTERVLLTEAVLFENWSPREISVDELTAMYFDAVGRSPVDARQHMVFNHVIDVEGDEASCEADLRAINVIGSGEEARTLLLGGRYRLRLRRERGMWLICERAIRERFRSIDPGYSEAVAARRAESPDATPGDAAQPE